MPWKAEQYRPKGVTREKRVREYDQQRGNSNERGYGAKWRRARESYLKEHPLCVECEREGQYTDAMLRGELELDHIVPHRGDMETFWDIDNWQTLCKTHHSAKTRKGL